MPHNYSWHLVGDSLLTDGSNIMIENKERLKARIKPLSRAEWQQIKDRQEGGDNNGKKSE
jgi:hypothetical protein